MSKLALQDVRGVASELVISANLLADEVERLLAMVDTLPLNGDGDRITLGSTQWAADGPKCHLVEVEEVSLSSAGVRLVDARNTFRNFERVDNLTLFTKKPKQAKPSKRSP